MNLAPTFPSSPGHLPHPPTPGLAGGSRRARDLRLRVAMLAALVAAVGVGGASAQSGNPFDDAGGNGRGGTERAGNQRGGNEGGGGGNPFDTAAGRSTPPAGPAAALANTPQVTTFKQYHFTDAGNNNMVAMTILAPNDWEKEGELTRLSNQYYNSPLALDVKFTAPDGRSARFLPSFSFEFSSPQENQKYKKFSPTANGNLFYPLPQSPGAGSPTWPSSSPPRASPTSASSRKR